MEKIWMARQIITLTWDGENYPVNKLHQYKYVIPISMEKLDGIYYHTFRVTPYHPDELFEQEVYGDQSQDFNN